MGERVKSKKRYIGGIAAILLAVSGIAVAADGRADDDNIVVLKADGGVVATDVAGKEERAVTTNSVLPPSNILLTRANGRAIVRVGSSGIIVVEKNSKIELGKKPDNARFFRQVTGMIYYALNTVKGKRQAVEVRTTNASLGIRGTRFLVTETAGRNEVAMRKGVVSVASPEGEFEIHRKVVQEEFEAFKQESADAIAKEEREFEEYKAATEREFIEYKRVFSLAANRMASFDGKRVSDRPLSAETLKDMSSSEAYAEEWLNQVRD